MNPTGETPMSALRLRSLVLVLCAASLAGCSGGKPGAATAPATSSMTVTVAAPVRQTVAREVVASGSVAAWQEMSLGVELAGLRVSQVLVEVGSRVSAGQPLVLLDRRTLEVQARQAEASLALLEQKLISTANFDELRANLGKAAAQLAAAEAERDSSVLRLGFATLRAPYAGIVSGRSVQPGQVVSAGAELLRLIRGGRLEWRAEVSESDLPRIQPGAAVQLRGPTGETVEGRIRAVSPAIDPQTRTALIYADLPAPGSLRAGMFAEGRLGVGTADVVVLPRQSVVFRDGYPYVFVIGKESRVAQRRIEVGQSTGAQVEIRSGVAADESVVVRGAGFLGDGDLVKVVAGS
jgi:RND family efflux transporter MFP subunit